MNKILIEPSKGWRSFSLSEAWEYRELLYFLIWRSIKLRYKYAIIGVTWVVLQPILGALIFSFIFGRLIKLSSEGHPYLIFVYCAFLPWNLFANALGKTTDGLLINRNLITKVYFPRIIIPVAIVIENFLDFFISLLVCAALFLIYKVNFSLNLLALPFFIALTLIITIGFGFWFSALNVKYRDVRYAVPFLIQIWFFSSPVAYGSTIIPEKWLFLYALNPIVGIIDGFRWSLLGEATNLPSTLPVSVAVSFIIFFVGLFYFLKTESHLTDII